MAIAETSNLTPELTAIQTEVEGYARGYGLDFYPTIFELIDADQLNAIAARGGFPTRYPHWRFGMEYEQLSKGYNYGLQKIYEMVINNNPCYAYLMRCNGLIDQKLVMAHVYGHCDFFKNNQWFAHTSRKMMDEMANHGSRIRRYMDEFGVEKVEDFVDACLSVEDLIDIHSPFIRRREEKSRYDFSGLVKETDKKSPARFESKDYMDRFINPRTLNSTLEDSDDAEPPITKIPERPERDVMLFILENAPLNSWQADVLSIIRDESYYFAPQAQTKIMNEGWASYWHSTIMIRQGLTAADVINYCDHHSGTLASSPTQLNPYKVGIELFRNIEDRWNRGAFGADYENCDDHAAQMNWNTDAGLGREKIFEVRRIHNDLTFIDEFLTLDFVREHRLFRFGYNERSDVYEIESREFPKVKQQLLNSLTNRGRPMITVVDGNYRNRGELYLEHRFSGVELQLDYARDTLENLQRLWGRPVHLETRLENASAVLSYDGSEHEFEAGDPVELADEVEEAF
ncbi:SpoVR family protein [Bythopirellula polymerisocia]|uniref:SpoVR family protein n=1 Tax=Bythopirellula polymerisocia TaxID=2528003 RepID=A0A5C6CAK0_9BACT|nr:SpoVR family protein [Bythopirellula polymerisocia]TWU21248.1 SpoVR family protein [Bythopirellula polymerisocia]